MTIVNKKVFLFLIFFGFLTFIYAENIVDKDFNYSLDLPEGYNLTDCAEDGRSYLFSHPNIPVSLIIKINSQESSKNSLETNLSKLKADYSTDSFVWNSKNCVISMFNMTLDQKYSGWAVCSPLKASDEFISILCYAPVEQFSKCEQFIMSSINSLCVDMDEYNSPGIIVTYAFPQKGKKNINLNIANTRVNTFIDKSDEEASQFIVDLEYGVLTLYAKHNLWKEAWQRYYRLIYRDSYCRLQQATEDIYNTIFPIAAKKNNLNKEITYAQYLLSWTQGFDYVRAESKTASDFTCLPGILEGKGSDCDSRSLLLCVLLKSIGIESLLLISPEYSHAMIVTEIEAPGQVYTLDGTNRNFIFGETTANVTWGMIAKDFSDQSKWIPVIFP